MTGPSISVYFVVEGRHLEAQAVLLAAPLRHHTGDSYHLIAYRPGTTGAPARATRDAFDALGVELRAFPVPADAWKKPFPHGNKILASLASRDTEAQVFLDTDVIACGPVDFSQVLQPGAVSVVPEGIPCWGKDGDRWDRAYAHFGLDLPTDRVRVTRRPRIEFYPYFNAGMIAWWSCYDGQDRSFAELWFDTARELDFRCKVALKRPWLDQIALPIALKRFGLGYVALPDRYNFSISNRAFEPEARPLLIHYHSFRYGPEWPQFRAEMDRMRDTYGPNLTARLAAEFAEFWHGQGAL